MPVEPRPDETLAQRVRDWLGDTPNVDEKRMFGGICFMVRGNMLCGVRPNRLMARVGPEAAAVALQRPHVRPMDFNGRTMKGYVFIDGPGLTEDAQLNEWLTACKAVVDSLPGKAMVPKKRVPGKAAAKPAPAKKAAAKKALARK